MASVRRATPADVDALVEMGRALHAESPRYRATGYDAEKVRALLHNLIGTPLGDNAAVFVALAGDEPVGVAIIVAALRWFGPDVYATDLTVYVKPEHRGGSGFPRMVAAMEAWAVDHGVQEIDIGVSTDIGTERTVHAYQRLGYTLSPTRVVTKKLHHGN